MLMLLRKYIAVIVVGFCGLFFVPVASASTTDGTIDSSFTYAWSDEMGWVNFLTDEGNIHITDAGITGYAWTSTYGWINFAPTSSGQSVTNNAEGNLSGFAWGQGVGFIDFANVSINSSGKFIGTATGDLAGTITFDCNECDVRTDWRPESVREDGGGGQQQGGGGGGGGGSTFVSVPVPRFPDTGSIGVGDSLEARLARVAALPVPVHSLVKIPSDGNPETQFDSAVYYVSANGRRHAFPNARVYATWYCDFSQVKEISLEAMAAIPLGQNVVYRPGNRMVKFTTVPTVYAVSLRGELHAIESEEIAAALYGAQWNKMIDDVPDVFFTDFVVGLPITNASDFDVRAQEMSSAYISDNMSIIGYVAEKSGTPLVCGDTKTVWPYSFKKNVRFTYDIYPETTDVLIVKWLQEFLRSQGKSIYSGPVSGIYGPQTKKAVQRFQKKYGIPQTGNVGVLMRGKMNEILETFE